MPLTEKELLERDAKRDIGAELLQSARELNAGLGKVVYRIKVPNATTLAAMAEAEKLVRTRSAGLKKAGKVFKQL